MNRIIAGLGVLFFLTPAQVHPAHQAHSRQEHGRYDFPVAVDGHEYVLTYEGTHDVMKEPDPAVKLVVFVHHGGSQNPVTYFKSLKNALDSAAADEPTRDLARTTMIIAPGMIGNQHIADNPKRYAGKHYPYWDHGWREGVPSLNKPEISNFDLLDAMVLQVADRFRGVKAIVHVGHSAGGQLLSRYSARSICLPCRNTIRAPRERPFPGRGRSRLRRQPAREASFRERSARG